MIRFKKFQFENADIQFVDTDRLFEYLDFFILYL